MKPASLGNLRLLVIACLVLCLQARAWGIVPTALVREGDLFADAPVEAIGFASINHVGGYAFGMTTRQGEELTEHFFGNTTGGTGKVLRSHATIGDLRQTNFGSRFGLSDNGSIAYASTVREVSTDEQMNSLWIDDTLIQLTGDPIVATHGSQIKAMNNAGLTADGIPHWLGFVKPADDFRAVDSVLIYDGEVILQGGDLIGVPEPVDKEGLNNWHAFSELGSHSIVHAVVDAPGETKRVIAIDGTAVIESGAVMRKGTRIPVAVGGDGIELYHFFAFAGINEAGDYFVTGDTNRIDMTTDDFFLKNGRIVMREGQAVGAVGWPLADDIKSAAMNADGDWVVRWNVDDGDRIRPALLVNGDLIYLEGDAVDWDGDGATDTGALMDGFNVFHAIQISDRDADGNVNLYFVADVSIDGLVLETAFQATIDPIPRWQNPMNSADVNGDRVVAAQDALLVINELLLRKISPDGLLPDERPTTMDFLDVDGSGVLAPRDVVQVINRLQPNRAISITLVPEPGELSLLGCALAYLVNATRRRDKLCGGRYRSSSARLY